MVNSVSPEERYIPPETKRQRVQGLIRGYSEHDVELHGAKQGSHGIWHSDSRSWQCTLRHDVIFLLSERK